MKKTLIIIGLILGICGAIFALLPSEIHTAIFGGDMDNGMGMDNSMQKGEMTPHNHGKYVTMGVLSAVIGFALAFAGWKILN